MKRFTQLLTISFLFAGLTACGGASDEAPDARYWKKIDREARFASRPLRQLRRLGPDALPGTPDDDALLAGGRGLRHRRVDGDRKGLRDGMGPGQREGMGPGQREGRRGMHRRGDGDRKGMRDGMGPHGMRDGDRKGLRDGRRGEGRRKGPPAEAVTACEDKAAGDTCSFVIEGETVNAVCKARRSGEGPLACRAGRGTHRRHDTPAQ